MMVKIHIRDKILLNLFDLFSFTIVIMTEHLKGRYYVFISQQFQFVNCFRFVKHFHV